LSSKLLEDRQAEMRERLLQERTNRKKHQFALEPKSASVAWDTAPDEPHENPRAMPLRNVPELNTDFWSFRREHYCEVCIEYKFGGSKMHGYMTAQ
jgi:hypothetical protein